MTASGVHVLASLGGTTWIQADPVPGRVVVSERDAESSWLRQPVVLVRWRALDDVSPSPTSARTRR